MDFSRAITNATPLLLQGVQLTILISVLSIAIGIAIGLLICLMGLSKNLILRGLSGVYIWLIRGTPMMVQAVLIYFGVPQLIQIWQPEFKIQIFVAGLITLSLNSGAYLAEIFRGGICAVPKGQSEAARSLGLSRARTMSKIVLPQAVKVAIPSMVNQFIITVKDTSILSAIGLGELMNKGRVYVGASYQFFETYSLVALYYLVIISALMIVSKKVERKFNYERKN